MASGSISDRARNAKRGRISSFEWRAVLDGWTLGLLVVAGVVSLPLLTMYRFPGRRFFEWALLLPLAVPAYVIAYTYTDLLEYSGPVQGALRALFGWTTARDYRFPEIRSLGGAAAMFTLVLYPYVYLLARSAFLGQSVGVLEVSRTLGRGPWQSFWAVALPMARPAIVVGVALALMETLNDYGTVDYFAVPTLTLGVFNAWFAMNSIEGAAQLSLTLLAVVMVVIFMERRARGGRRFQESRAQYKPLPGYPLYGVKGMAAFTLCLLPVILGFLVPAGILVSYALVHYEESLSGQFYFAAFHSISLSGIAAAVAVAIGLFIAYALRQRRPGGVLRGLAWVASLGYGVPGAILAVGAIIPVARFDNFVDAFMRETFGISTGLLLSGTIFAVILGYVVRFLVLSLGTIESGFSKITPSMDDAARSLGHGTWAVLRRVQLPMLRGSMLTAALLVFVDSMKELPMTLLLRPFNYETLATYVYQFASDELLEECALGALTIVLVGIGPVMLLTGAIRRARPGGFAP